MIFLFFVNNPLLLAHNQLQPNISKIIQKFYHWFVLLLFFLTKMNKSIIDHNIDEPSWHYYGDQITELHMNVLLIPKIT